MPEVRATRSVDRPLTEIWSFVEEMDNWAPLMKGYVDHAKENERDSIWTLRGDLGPFSKTVKMRVHITEWAGPSRVAFELVGIDEAVSGVGAFDLSTDQLALPTPTRSWVQRLLDWLFRRPPEAPPEPARSHVVFTFEIDAGGPMGPMINALLGPWTEEVARDLLEQVGTKLEVA